MNFKLPDNLYNILKWVCLIVLPAVAVLYGTLGNTWGLPYIEQICITINAVATFIGVVIGVSTMTYNKNK